MRNEIGESNIEFIIHYESDYHWDRIFRGGYLSRA